MKRHTIIWAGGRYTFKDTPSDRLAELFFLEKRGLNKLRQECLKLLIIRDEMLEARDRERKKLRFLKAVEHEARLKRMKIIPKPELEQAPLM
jgi:hypothetical protein